LTNGHCRWFLAGLVLTLTASLATSLGAKQSENPRVLVTPTISTADAAGHRLWVLLFDTSSMQALDVLRAKRLAVHWIDAIVGKDDLVSILTVSDSLKLQQNFTTNGDSLRQTVERLTAADSAQPPGDRDLQERDYFNNDLRFRGLRTLCSGLQAIQQKKAIVLFTALRPRPGADNQVEVRAATDACNRANATINPIDVSATRGPGGR
jgi:VWFA-related protein